MSKRGTAIHPEIGSLIRKRDYIHYNLMAGNYVQSLRLMKLLLMELKPEDRKTDKGKEVFEEIEKQLNEVRKQSRKGYHHVNAVGIINTYTRAKSHVFEELYTSLNSILWDKGYLLNESYGVIIKEDPTTI